ncbi:MAG TPA: hypothetical protein VF442_10540 [Sphingobium sp.]
MSSSKSQQTQTQQFTDNRLVQGQGALYANNGATLNSYVLDNGAVQGSFDAINNVVGKSYDLAGDALARTTDQVAKVTTQAFNFGSDVVASAVGLTQHGLDRVLDQTATTQQLVADAYNDAKGRGALTDKILIAAVAGALLVALAAVKKG